MPRREFLMLAHKYEPNKTNVGGWYVSEKLDGSRCFWDGGITRDLPVETVPWANLTNPKTGERKNKVREIATGLWSRYGNPIIAPNWWLNQLPCIPLDGELWAGRGQFQLCQSITRRDLPSKDWENIQFAVIGSPPFEAIFADGLIKNANMVKEISLDAARSFLDRLSDSKVQDYRFIEDRMPFEDELRLLEESLPTDGVVYLLRQKRLPDTGYEKVVELELERILDKGGEGLIMRAPRSIWTPKRSHNVLKYKPFSDAEGLVVGFTSGRRTDKGSRLLGKIGSLIIDYQGKRLDLSGMTDDEREFATTEAEAYAEVNPGVDMPLWTQGKIFKTGTVVSMKYRELTNDGIPKEARLWRIRETV